MAMAGGGTFPVSVDNFLSYFRSFLGSNVQHSSGEYGSQRKFLIQALHQNAINFNDWASYAAIHTKLVLPSQ